MRFAGINSLIVFDSIAVILGLWLFDAVRSK